MLSKIIPMKKVCLLILDWFGINETTPEENSIIQSQPTPTIDWLFNHPDYTRLEASGRDVGIPDWFMGGSEVGHLTIWAGRIIPQSILEISDLFEKNNFKNIAEYKNMISQLEQNQNTLHIAWMLWFEGVHAYQQHLHDLLDILPNTINISLHIFTDGRDTPIMDSHWFLEQLLENIKDKKHIILSSIWWRYFAWDRDGNWERTQKTFNAMTGVGEKNNQNPLDILKESYKEMIFDEFVEPQSLIWWSFLKKWDCFLNFHFRSDRATQITKKALEFLWEKNIYTMTKYFPEYSGHYFIKREEVDNTLSDILSKNNLTQLHLAETEKFAHVTKFFNGVRTGELSGEKHILIPSHKVEWWYDSDPAMSAFEILDTFKNNCNNYNFSVVNIANWDMVWHTGKLQAAMQAIQTIEAVTTDFIKICTKNNINLFITADHGNCEVMGTIEKPMTAHTTNLVPFWYISGWKIILTKKSWWLSNIAPSICQIMWIQKGSDMVEGLLIDSI